jgi:hypothetical protein
MNTRKRAELYRDPEDIAFTKWVDESFPIRSRNFKGEVLFAGSKYDDVYLISELVQIYKKKNVMLPKQEKIIVEVMAWVSVVTLISAVLFLIFN